MMQNALMVKIKFNVAILIIISLVFFLSSINSTFAEFGVGGTLKFKRQAQASSAILNDAFSEFHAYIAEIDRGNLDKAETRYRNLNKLLRDAEISYKFAANEAGERKLKPIVNNRKDLEDLRYFWANADHFEIPFEPTEIQLAIGMSRAVSYFGSRLSDLPPRALLDNVPNQQRAIELKIDLEQFLLSVTTFLSIG